jgi:hypothetical protein
MEPDSNEHNEGLQAATGRRERNVTPNGTKYSDLLDSPPAKKSAG